MKHINRFLRRRFVLGKYKNGVHTSQNHCVLHLINRTFCVSIAITEVRLQHQI